MNGVSAVVVVVVVLLPVMGCLGTRGQQSPHRSEVFWEGLFRVLKPRPPMGADGHRLLMDRLLNFSFFYFLKQCKFWFFFSSFYFDLTLCHEEDRRCLLLICIKMIILNVLVLVLPPETKKKYFILFRRILRPLVTRYRFYL